MHRTALIPLLACMVAVAGCGEDAGRTDNAVDAQEQNAVEVGGVSYRAVLFRELNPRLAPDEALVASDPPGGGRGYYGLFITACNRTSKPQSVPADIHVEDAFGAVFRPRSEAVADAYRLRPTQLEPEECLPREGGVADRTFGGVPLVFSIPYDSTRDRPLVMEVRAGGEQQRVQLDL